MRVENKTKTVKVKVYIADDGKEFKSIKECESHDSWLRGREIVQKCFINDELRFYFKATDIDTWRDALKYIGERLYNDFTSYNDFSDFEGKWVFSNYDRSGEFYKLKTSDELVKYLEAEIDSLSADISRINMIVNN